MEFLDMIRDLVGTMCFISLMFIGLSLFFIFGLLISIFKKKTGRQ